MKTYFYLMTLSLVLASTAMAAPQPQNFKLKYLSEVTHGHVIHTVDVKAQDFNDALTKSRSLCLKGLLDRHVASEDIVDMCANPRL